MNFFNLSINFCLFICLLVCEVSKKGNSLSWTLTSHYTRLINFERRSHFLSVNNVTEYVSRVRAYPGGESTYIGHQA
jgi:hypothetical protein